MSIIKRVRIGRSPSPGRSQASLARSSAIMASGTLVVPPSWAWCATP